MTQAYSFQRGEHTTGHSTGKMRNQRGDPPSPKKHRIAASTATLMQNALASPSSYRLVGLHGRLHRGGVVSGRCACLRQHTQQVVWVGGVCPELQVMHSGHLVANAKNIWTWELKAYI